MRWHKLVFQLILCCLPFLSEAQLSYGGYPRPFTGLKSTSPSAVVLPAVDNQKLLVSSLTEFNKPQFLKPLRFAYPFEVNLDPTNSGAWGISEDGYQVWQVEIKSEGAFSLNLKFEDFRLPPSARLFIFNSGLKQLLGSFTVLNNDSSRIFAVSPVQGDDIFVQYEIPPSFERRRDFRITRVNHDYLNILKAGDRRPLGTVAGGCNLDINCGAASNWAKVKEAVCRVIIDGVELCTGTLLNNTSENKIPYVLTANHCISSHGTNFSTVFLFNYESPYCGSIDGDVTNSLSGSVLKASFDSLDFALLQLNISKIPSTFRPYYAGWNRTGNIPDSVATVHHPQGDIKKIAIDRNSPVIASYNSEYTKNGFWKTLKWEVGTTEKGSSGAPYFNPQLQMTGTLTGGAAICQNSVNDYFSRFDRAWDYRSEPEKQLKFWLDPGNTGLKSLWGRNFNTGVDYCDAFTNLRDGDKHQLVRLINSAQKFSGYWTGTNGEGLIEFAEKFIIKGNEVLQGVSFGVGMVKLKQSTSESKITLKVYQGNGEPKNEIYSQQVRIRDLAQDAMNYIKFSQVVVPIDTFYISFDLAQVQAGDTFAVYQTVRNSYPVNSFMYKKGTAWLNFNNSGTTNKPGALVCEALACNIDSFSNDTHVVKGTVDVLCYPNPFISQVNVESGEQFEPENISVFDLLGHKVYVKVSLTSQLKARIDFSGNVPGIYVIRLKDDKRNIARKVAYSPR
jgi:lysyl endopeptidase